MIGSIYLNPGVAVRHTGTPKGRGVFAGRDYGLGEMVETSPVAEIRCPWDELPGSVKRVVYDWGYLLGDVDEHLRCIALGAGSLFNHSKTPNLAYAADGDRQALVFTATREIKLGEEFTIDYNADIKPGEVDWFTLVGVSPVDD